MIKVKRSPTADTRTCDWSKVTKEELLRSSQSHIHDVRMGMGYFAIALVLAGGKHDFDKVSQEGLDAFHRDFVTGFKRTEWWDNHRKVNRHHINMDDGVRDDIDLLDVIEHVVDCIMAGMARSGKVTDIFLEGGLLQKAVHNTMLKLVAQVEVED